MSSNVLLSIPLNKLRWSHSRSLRSPDLDRARAAIRDANVEGPYKYTIDQENCH